MLGGKRRFRLLERNVLFCEMPRFRHFPLPPRSARPFPRERPAGLYQPPLLRARPSWRRFGAVWGRLALASPSRGGCAAVAARSPEPGDVTLLRESLQPIPVTCHRLTGRSAKPGGVALLYGWF